MKAKVTLKDRLGDRINDLFARCEWKKARALLQAERERKPDSHWVLTQLGVTHYEERRYQHALGLFQASLQLVPDCPLTLWNLAGTLDALGKHNDAAEIYTCLLKSNKSAKEDPCWESKEWAASLKVDCVYRLGVCFQGLRKKPVAEQCFREYVELLLRGFDGSYPIEDAMRLIRNLENGKNAGADAELTRFVNSTLKLSGIKPSKRTVEACSRESMGQYGPNSSRRHQAPVRSRVSASVKR
jgi:tetratricopeptide (TPR) repeat protein